MNRNRRQLLDLIQRRDARVGVIGLGYVGLPLVLAFCEAGFQVLGFDLDSQKVATLNDGRTYLAAFPEERIRPLVEKGKLEATSALHRLGEPDVLIICVPTPLAADATPDLSHVESTVREISQRLRPGQLVILESTTYPGTTEDILQPALEASGKSCGTDFFLAYSPEREDPGSSTHRLESIPKVVGGVDPDALDLAVELYGCVVPTTVPVSSARVAEASKLTENIFRAVNIALVNELKVVYDSMGINVHEVLDAAETKPFGFMRFDPGPGWGGHCIPIDPFYLAWSARQSGAEARFIELAGEINVMMPKFVVGKLEDALAQKGRDLDGAKVLLLGLSYKKDVADPRESPAFEILDLLIARGVKPAYHDPLIPRAPAMRRWQDLESLESQPLTAKSLSSYDAVLVVTDHSTIDYDLVREHSRLIVDTRRVFRHPADHIISA